MVNAQGCDEDIQSKLLALNGLIEHDQLGPNNHHRAPFNHSGLSEDSDYTSDVSVPVNHHQLHPNSSAHQYESHLHPHRSRQLLHTREGATLQASYEDEEDAYHARNSQTDDVYHQDDTLYYDEYRGGGGGASSSQYHGRSSSTYEDTVTPVREYGSSGGGGGEAVPPAPTSSSASSSTRRHLEHQGYGYSDERYDTPPMSTGRLPRDEPIMEHNEPEYVYDQNGYPDDENYGINPTYSEDQFDDQPAYSGRRESYRNDYDSSYQREYWNESEPLSYNSRPPNGHVRTSSSAWREPGTSSSRPTPSQAWNYTDDTHQYDEVDRGSRHSFTRTPSVDRADRRSDSGGGYYDEFGERINRPDSHHNWRYDSIQEEDTEKDTWKTQGYEEGGEAGGDETPKDETTKYKETHSPESYHKPKEIHFEEPHPIVRQTIQEEEEKRNYQELWHSAYKRVCADLGIKNSQNVYAKIQKTALDASKSSDRRIPWILNFLPK
uniref:CUT domain-containing protein n=1 Tax=Caenorhabditis tropicalis TaxID=1561998 RepID=A0A1I7UKH5_9PELO